MDCVITNKDKLSIYLNSKYLKLFEKQWRHEKGYGILSGVRWHFIA
jgi:hypothetical protein